jgi:hypothetical protein
MSTRRDILDVPSDPDRVFYELGVMLDKADFDAEQTYHRGRLARALAFLNGGGTVAGLKVRIDPPGTSDPPSPADEEVHVAPGLALDRIGRLVELPTMPGPRPGRCIRLQRWLDATEAGRDDGVDGLLRSERLRKAYRPDDPASTAPGKVIVDVFLRFAACERDKTPAFATGPFDALDAVQPARIRDGFELQLVPRGEQNPPAPADYWRVPSGTTRAQRAAALQEKIFGAWDRFRHRRPDDPAANDPVVPDWLDPRNDRHWIFLARLLIPCTDGGVDRPPVRDAARPVEVENGERAFVYTAAMLAQFLL